MDWNVYAKLLIKQALGRHLPVYAGSSDKLNSLREIIPLFMRERLANRPADKKVLYTSMGCYDPGTEAIYLKALEELGYEPYILTNYNPYVIDIFKNLGISNIRFYEDYYRRLSPRKIRQEVKACLGGIRDMKGLLALNRNGIKVGQWAASWFMRITRSSTIDFGDTNGRALLDREVYNSIRAAEFAEILLADLKPDLAFIIDRYTPFGQLFDAALHKGIPVISKNGSHKSGSDILKRFSSPAMSVVHPQSLSEKSWEYVRKFPWSEQRWHKLYEELRGTYFSGDWFAEVGTQFNKKVYAKTELVSKLQLDEKKKTAVIFPHMFWDATFFWGEDLFEDYHDWFVNVVRVAAENKRLNWIIKVHPANLVKAKRDNYHGENSELKAIHETLGRIPEHLRIIPPESDINTFSLFDVMDYCLTVRGTIGIESAVMGINTLTAGTGRYDRLGFTRDFASKADYLSCIASLDEMPPMAEGMIELARRYAYGLFILRPIRLDLLDYGYNQDDEGSLRFRPLFKNREDFENSGFVRGLRNFIQSGDADYLDRRNGVRRAS